MAEDTHGNPIVAFFTWWNQAMADTDKLTEEGFARFFTPDAQIRVRDNLRAGCPAEMVPHYAAIAASFDSVQMVLPVTREMATGDLAFVHCHTRVIDKGVSRDDAALAYAELVDGRICRLTVAPMV